MKPPDPEELHKHLDWVADCLTSGEVTFFLGAGVNLCDRPGDVKWDPARREYLPTAAELAEYLARELRVPAASTDLARVAQFAVTLRDGAGV